MADTSEPLKRKTEILLTRSSAFSDKLIPFQEHVSSVLLGAITLGSTTLQQDATNTRVTFL
jgi:hypothetical protein